MQVVISFVFVLLFIQTSASPALSRVNVRESLEEVDMNQYAYDRVQEDSNDLSSSKGRKEPVEKPSTPDRITAFYDEYYKEKKMRTDIPLWNLIPTSSRDSSSFANSLKALLPSGCNDSTDSTSSNKLYSFNISEIGNMKNKEIVAAELRVQLSYTSLNDDTKGDTRHRLKVYRAHPNKQLVYSTKFTTLPTGDVIAPVTDVVKEWLTIDKDPSLTFHVKLMSPSGESSAVLDSSPLLVLYIDNKEMKQKDHFYSFEERRNKRSAHPGAPPQNRTKACRVLTKQFSLVELNLHKEIQAPTIIDVTYCSGHCHWPFTVQNATNSGRMQGRVNALTGKIPGPCCAPRSLEPQMFLKPNADGMVMPEYEEDFIVTSCECK